MYQKIEINPIYCALRTAERWIDDLYDGRIFGMVLHGPPGVGKSFLAQTVAGRRGLPIIKPRPGTPRGLLDVLQQNANERVAVLDELDWVWGNEAATNTLKLALDNTSRRVISHDVGGYNFSIDPFEIVVRLLFTSNKNFNDPAEFTKKIWESGVLPLKNRCVVLGVPYDYEALYHYVGWLCTEQAMLKPLYFDYPIGGMMQMKNGEMVSVTHGNRRRFLSRAEANEVLAHFAANAHRYPSISPREIVRFGLTRIGKSYDEWEQQIEPLLTGNWPLNNLCPYEIT